MVKYIFWLAPVSRNLESVFYHIKVFLLFLLPADFETKSYKMREGGGEITNKPERRDVSDPPIDPRGLALERKEEKARVRFILIPEARNKVPKRKTVGGMDI